MDQYNTIEGKFRVIIFQSDNYYTVAKFKTDDKEEKQLTVTGYFKDLLEDTPYRLFGNYKEHPRYGMQFETMSYERILPNDTDSLIRYFSSSIFPHVGKKAAEKIVNALGKDAIQLLKQDVSIIYQVVGLNLKQCESIKNGIDNDASVDDSIVFLTQHGMSMRNIMKVESIYKEDTIKIIKKNPYQMIIDIDGIGFKTADKIASSLGFGESDPNRIKAYIVDLVLKLSLNSGNTFIAKEMIYQNLYKDFPILNEQQIEDYINELVKESLLFIDDDRYYHMTQYQAENGIANFLHMFPSVEHEVVEESLIHQKIDNIEKELSIEYEEKQKNAILNFFLNSFSIITGGPGTGKTTIVRGIISIYKELFPEYRLALCAPTGRAAKRLGDLSKIETSTIHSLLKWDLETNKFAVNEENPLEYDVLIIDEFSMVDSWLFYNILKASYFVKKIVLIGDVDQLPSVGPGFVLKDLIESNQFQVTSLSKIFRQQEGSDVVKLALEIKEGNCDILKSSQEVKIFPCVNYQIKNQIVKIVKNAYDKGYNENDIQVLAPMYNGVAGIDSLNKALQELSNPKTEFKRELKVGYRTFREGDKILQLKNQPDDNVYNGDIGRLVEIVYSDEDFNKQDRIFVDFDGIIVEYTSDNFQVITHAYCISIHKSQGSEYPIVIMPILKDYQFMLQRRLIYTGITRAKKSLVLLGSEEMLIKGINREDRFPRKTYLKEKICKIFE